MRHLKLPLVLLILLTNLLIYGQGANFVWAQRFGGNLNDNCYSACDKAGNVYRIQGGIAKHNSAGAQQWTITTAYNVQKISFDAAGDLYVTGIFNNTIDLDHGAGTQNVSSVGLADIAVIKLSGSTGNFIWGGSMGSSGNDYDAIIYTDAAGSSYIGGSFTGVYDVDPGAGTQNLTASSTDFYVSRLDAGGNLLWAKQFAGTSSGWIGSMDLDAAGDLYFCGGFSGTVDFDPGAPVTNLSSSGTNTDMYLCKLDGSGNFGWVKQMGAAGQDYIHQLELGSNGNLYCSGIFTGLVDLDGGQGVFTLNSGTLTNAFVAEFSSNGTPNWAHQFTGFYVTAMALDKNDGICMTGTFEGADFDPGPGTYSMSAFGGTWPDIYISKLSSSGNFLWAKMLGNINNDDAYTISIDGANNIHVAGRFKTTCDFDPNGGNYPLTAAGGNLNYDGFMLKLCQTPDQPAILAGSTTLCNGSSETYSVNLIAGVQYYTWALPFGWTGSSTTNSILISPASNNGTLSVKASNSCGTSYASTVSVIVTDCTGLATTPAGTGLNVYPNPSAGLFTLQLPSPAKITITDVCGRIIYSQKLQAGATTLDLKDQAAGIYFFSAEADGWKENLRLAKE